MSKEGTAAHGSGITFMDADVQSVEPSTSVVIIDDDELPTPLTSEATECPPLITIQFHGSELFRTLQLHISAAIETVLRTHMPDQSVAMRPDPDQSTLRVLKAKANDTGESLFVVDSTPTKDKKNDGPIPSYKKVMNKVYEGQTPETTPNSMTKRARAKQTCWNCEGDHGLKDCKRPRNYARIRQKKEEFQRRSDRYHAEMEQKFGHITPGRLSKELRDALGLGSRDLPLHVYKMRQYGYPPGWLEDAKITHSGLQLFDSNGDAVQHSDDSDGEVENGRNKYDVRKIIAFPGFNEPPDGRMFDDYKYYNVPPYTDELSRGHMINQLEGTLVHGYRRKKLKLSIEENSCANVVDPTSNMELVDMDASVSSPPAAEPLQVDLPPPEPPQSDLPPPDLPPPDLSPPDFPPPELPPPDLPPSNLPPSDLPPSDLPPPDLSPPDLPPPYQPPPDLPPPELLPPELPPKNSVSVPRKEELEEGELSDASDEPERDESVILIETPIEVITLDDTMLTDPRSPSPSMDNLQKRQQQLVAQLSDPANLNDVSLEDISNATLSLDSTLHPATFSSPALAPAPPLPANAVPTPEGSAPLPPSTPTPPPPPPPPAEEPSPKPPEPETLNLGEIAMTKLPYLDDPGSVGLKKMSLGTPILRAFTPYSSLPSGEAFSKGVSDVINFENLPNSTGKYAQMKSLLTRVRQKITDHMRLMDDGR